MSGAISACQILLYKTMIRFQPGYSKSQTVWRFHCVKTTRYIKKNTILIHFDSFLQNVALNTIISITARRIFYAVGYFYVERKEVRAYYKTFTWQRKKKSSLYLYLNDTLRCTIVRIIQFKHYKHLQHLLLFLPYNFIHHETTTNPPLTQ